MKNEIECSYSPILCDGCKKHKPLYCLIYEEFWDCEDGCKEYGIDIEQQDEKREENEMTKVYFITDGNHSDYHICSVFLDEKKAKEIQKRFGANIETWNADEINEYVKHGDFYSVSMDREGNTFKCDKLTYGEKIYWPLYEPMINIYTNSMAIVVHANDTKHAIKIANNIRRQRVADGKWDLY